MNVLTSIIAKFLRGLSPSVTDTVIAWSVVVGYVSEYRLDMHITIVLLDMSK